MSTAAHLIPFAFRAPLPFRPRAGRPAVHPAPAVRYVCDAASHRVHRVDDRRRLLDSFGGRGSLPGQFEGPSDSTVVMPMFEGEEDIAGCSQAAFVAVADRMNHRVQVFELEGQFVTAIGEFSEGPASGRPERDGWPYFRLTPQPVLNEPVRLRWEAPWLHVIDADGQQTRVDLAYVMLPSFEAWLAAAPAQTLLSAQHHFRYCVRHTETMAGPLARLETALGEAWLLAGEVDAATRLWSLGWPAGIPSAVAAAQAEHRARTATTAAFRFGSAHRVTRLRAAVRLAAPPPAAHAAPEKAPDAPSADAPAAATDRMCVGE